jgi:hypothetical protein
MAGLIIYISLPGTYSDDSQRDCPGVFEKIKVCAIKNDIEILRTEEEMQALFVLLDDDSGNNLLSVIEYCSKDSIISIFTCFPAYVEASYFSSISLYLMEINNSIDKGYFKLDISIRQIHFRTYITAKNFNPNDSVLLKELKYNQKVMNSATPAIFKNLGIIVADSSNCGEEEVG